MVKLETRVIITGTILCLTGLILFTYGITNMNQINAISNSFLIIIGIFLGMAGMIMLAMNVFPNFPGVA